MRQLYYPDTYSRSSRYSCSETLKRKGLDLMIILNLVTTSTYYSCTVKLSGTKLWTLRLL